eukprot:IDg17776t1
MIAALDSLAPFVCTALCRRMLSSADVACSIVACAHTHTISVSYCSNVSSINIRSCPFSCAFALEAHCTVPLLAGQTHFEGLRFPRSTPF